MLAASVLCAARQLDARLVPAPIAKALDLAAELRSLNRYGRFAVMTTERPEIEFAVSADAEHWETLTFPWKPGPLERWPTFTQPHMPRLDWQLWFAALQGCGRARWLREFSAQLLRGSPAVWSLLGREAPTLELHALRSTLYRYEPAAPSEWHGRGVVWRRERLGSFCPDLELRRD
jgi:hypothetical protein